MTPQPAPEPAPAPGFSCSGGGRILFLAAVFVCFVAARHRAVPPPAGGHQPIPDVFTASNPRSVESTHLALDLTVDFDAKVLRGSVTHTLVHHDGGRQFIVDT